MPTQPRRGRRAGVRSLHGFALLVIAAALPGSGQPLGTAEVELALRRPDGTPLANAPVRVRPTTRPTDGRPDPELLRLTDAAGRLTFRWPIGVVRQMAVRADDVGYGYVGTLEVVPGQTTRRALPPLVAFGRVEGIVPAQLARPGAVLTLHAYGDFESEAVTPKIVGDRFTATVRAGTWFANVTHAGKCLATADAGTFVGPGQAVTGITLRPPPQRDRDPSWSDFPVRRSGVSMKHWFHGTVRDEGGRPVAGATVYAVAEMFGSFRRYDHGARATTDAAGRYEIGPEGPHDFSATIIAHVADHPPGLAWATSYGADPPVGAATRPATAPAPPEVDLVVPERGGTLVITLRRGGHGVAGIPVIAHGQGHEIGGRGGRSSDDVMGELNAVVRPAVLSDTNGVARFEHLLPGLYDVSAMVPADGHFPADRPVPILGPVAHETLGIAVRPGEVAAHAIDLSARPSRGSMKILRPDGEVLRPTSFFVYGAQSGGLYSNAFESKGNGLYEATFPAPGLWRVSFAYRDSGIDAVARAGAEPYNEAVGIVAAGPWLLPTAAAKFTVVRRELGSLRVELRDLAGQPARGAVEVAAELGAVQAAGSTDGEGVVRFEGLPSGKYAVRAFARGEPHPDLGPADAPLPDPAKLAGHSLTLGQTIQITASTERRLVMRAQGVGYVYGTVKLAPGRAAAEYNAFAWSDVAPSDTPTRYRAATGEFVAGPFPAGRIHVVARSERRPGAVDRAEKAERIITAEPGHATRVDLPPPVVVADAEGPPTFGWFDASPIHLAGRVLLHDGKTPAVAARVLLIGPDGQPDLAGLTDARGVIREYGLSRLFDDHAVAPIEPVVIAWLPGACGPVVRPLGNDWRKPWEFVLPPPNILRGKVTVGGAAPAGAHSGIRVTATRPGGAGRLERLLAVEIDADPDGSFELAGLPPGENEVQAALDGVWLSASVTVRAADGPLDRIKLEIPAPGGPLVVRVLDAGGAPLSGRTIALDRPPGPLARELWPAFWTTDGAGEVRVPALEAGKHRLRIPGTPWAREIDISAGPSNAPVELELRDPPIPKN